MPNWIESINFWSQWNKWTVYRLELYSSTRVLRQKMWSDVRSWFSKKQFDMDVKGFEQEYDFSIWNLGQQDSYWGTCLCSLQGFLCYQIQKLELLFHRTKNQGKKPLWRVKLNNLQKAESRNFIPAFNISLRFLSAGSLFWFE